MLAGGINLVTPETCLSRSYVILLKLVLFCIHRFFTCTLCNLRQKRRPDWTLNGNRRMSEPSTLKDLVDTFQLKLEHLCTVLKSCLTLELECTSVPKSIFSPVNHKGLIRPNNSSVKPYPSHVSTNSVQSPMYNMGNPTTGQKDFTLLSRNKKPIPLEPEPTDPTATIP